MAASSTLGTIVAEVAERTGLGRVLREVDPDSVTTTTLTLANSYLLGPFSGAQIPVGSIISFVSPADTGTATGSATTTITDSTKAWTVDEWHGFTVRMGGWSAVITDNDATSLTFAALDAAPTTGKYTIEFGTSRVTNYAPATGVVTYNTLGGTMNTALVKPFTAIIWDKDVAHVDRVLDAVNRALTNRLGRWVPRPLTFVPDGDLQGATVTDYWTAAANGTAAYATAQVYPAGSAADAVGQVGVSRLLQLTTSGGSSNVDGNGIRVQLSTSERTWHFWTAIRLVSGTGTVTFSVRDSTNTADIDLQVTQGNDSNTLTTTTLGDFMICEGTFQLPATCAEIAPRLACSATGMVAQMGPVIMFPANASRFPLPNRIQSDEDIGNFMWGHTTSDPGGLEALCFSEPVTTGGAQHSFQDYGDHRTVHFNFMVNDPLWYEEYVRGTTLSGMAETSTFSLDRIVKWAVFELYDRLMREEMNTRARADNGSLLSSQFRIMRNAALKEAQWSRHEPPLKYVVGRGR